MTFKSSEHLGYLKLSKVGGQLWQRYGSTFKERNAVRLGELQNVGSEQIDAYPWRIVLETGNVCNLKCCQARGCVPQLRTGFLTADAVEPMLAELWPFLVQVNLFNWGEPMLNPELARIVRIVHAHDVGTQIHSHMNDLPEALAEGLIDAGLDFLVASIDGVSEQVYQQYRIGGSAEVALGNLKTFVEVRKAKKSSTPRIIWRFLCLPHNRDEIETARERASEIGVDDFVVGEGAFAGYLWTAQGKRLIRQAQQKSEPPFCRDLYDFPVIHWDGTVLPCCNSYKSCFVWADLSKQSWLEAVNTDAFRAARRLAAGDLTIESPCKQCDRIPDS